MNNTKILTQMEAAVLCNGLVNIPKPGYRRTVIFSTKESPRNLGYVSCSIRGEYKLSLVQGTGFINNVRVGTLLKNGE